MQKFTVIWNKHGAGSLVGIFNDPLLIQKIKDSIDQNGQHNYFAIHTIELNHINRQALEKDLRQKPDF